MAEPIMSTLMIVILVVVSIWELIWKGIAMWKSARQEQKAWFVCILIFNTLGILSIVYLVFFQKKKKVKK